MSSKETLREYIADRENAMQLFAGVDDVYAAESHTEAICAGVELFSTEFLEICRENKAKEEARDREITSLLSFILLR